MNNSKLSHNKIKNILLLLGILFLLSCNYINQDNIPEKTIQLEEISFPTSTIEGKSFNISNFKEKNILLNFWFPSCPPCVYELEILKKIDDEFEGTQVIGIQMLGLDTKQDGIRMLENKKILYPSVADEKDEIVLDLDITAFPTTILFNKNGIEEKRWIGIIDEKIVEKKLQEIENK